MGWENVWSEGGFSLKNSLKVGTCWLLIVIRFEAALSHKIKINRKILIIDIYDPIEDTMFQDRNPFG